MAEKIALLSWPKALLGGLILAGLIYIVCNDDPAQFEQKRSAAARELESAKKSLAQTEDALKNAARFEEENKQLEAAFKEMVEFLPSELNASELVRTLNAEAKKSGSEIASLTPQNRPPERTEFYETSKIDMQLRGTYAQLVLFMSYLTHVPRLLTFDKMEMVVDAKKGNRIVFSATLVAYRYVGAPGEDGAKDGNEKAQPKPN